MLIKQELEITRDEIDTLNKKVGDTFDYLDISQKIKISEGRYTFARYEVEVISIEPNCAKVKVKKRIN